MRKLILICALGLAMAGCDDNPADDAGPGVRFDAGPGGDFDAGPGGDTDAGPGGDTDAGPGGDTDAGPGGDTDAGPGGDTDGGAGMDGGGTDAGRTDAGRTDAGMADAGPPPPPTVVELAAGRFSSCARISDGSLECWGLNDVGQTGEPVASSATCLDRDGMTSLACTPLPRPFAGLSGVVDLAMGGDHGCVIDAAGAVFCWGYNITGQLGRGTSDTVPHPAPAAVTLPGRATQIAAGRFHTCAVVGSGAASTVHCWGLDANGQAGVAPASAPTCAAGTGTIACLTSPRQVGGISGVAEIVAGRGHTCARLIAGGVRCWGGNDAGQLGIGTSDTTAHPVPEVLSLTGVTALGAGNEHTCAIGAGGAVRCWGLADAGQIGFGTSTTPSTCGPSGMTSPCILAPTMVMGLTGATAVDGGDFFTCAIHGAGAESCWGVNNRGQLGVPGASVDCGGFQCARAPVLVTGISGANALALGGAHVLTGTTAGPRAWGDNIMRQAGIGSAAMQVNTPSPIMMLP